MVALAWLVYAYFGAMAVSFAPILPMLERSLRITSAGGGALLGAYPLMYIVSSFAIGSVCDRIGVKASTASGIAIISFSMYLRSSAHSFWEMLFAAALLGLGGPVVSTVLPKLVAERFEGPIRTFVAGIYISGPTVGAALVLALTNSEFLRLLPSWRSLFFAYFLVGTVVLVLWIAFSADVSRRPTHREVEGWNNPSTESVESKALNVVWRSRAVWTITIVGVIGFTISQGFSSWLPTILQTKGFTASTAGIWVGVARLCGVPGSLAVTFLGSRVRFRGLRKRFVVVLLACSGVSVALIAAHIGPIIYPLLVLQSAASASLLPLLMAILMDLPEVSAQQMATAAALYFTVGQIAGAGAPILVGWLRDLTGGFTTGILFVAAAALVAVLPALRIDDVGTTVPIELVV